MLIAYLIVSTLIGMLLTFAWQSTSGLNLIIKVMFALYTLWSILLLFGVLTPMLAGTNMRLV